MVGGDGANESCMYESRGAAAAHRSEWRVEVLPDCRWGGRMRWPLLWWIGTKSASDLEKSGVHSPLVVSPSEDESKTAAIAREVVRTVVIGEVIEEVGEEEVDGVEVVVDELEENEVVDGEEVEVGVEVVVEVGVVGVVGVEGVVVEVEVGVAEAFGL